MKKIIVFFEKLLTYISIYYIKFVYKTSKVVPSGRYELLNPEKDEKFVCGFWHGDSYSLYPFFRGKKLYIITTKNGRGDYITLICNKFGYNTIRVPDENLGGNFLFKIKKEVNGEDKGNLVIAFDGPLGPYHEPKPFPYIAALLTKRRVLPVSINCKRKITLTKRWDDFVIPLPFNKIEIHFHDPLEVSKNDINDNSISLKTRETMEAWKKTK